MEFILVVCAIVFVALIVWRMRTKARAKSRATKDAALERAWRIVLEDPNYPHRRRYEERKRDDEARARKEEGL